MKKLLMAVVALAFSATASNAGWTGCKVGAFAGVSATHTEASLSTPLLPGSSVDIDGLGTQGMNGGLAAGCDLQVGQFVVGAFGDYTFQDLDWTTGVTFAGTQIAELRTGIEDMWAVGARAGYLATPTTLVYATAGYTEAKSKDLGLSFLSTPVVSWSVGDLSGWFVGGGIETMVWKQLSLAVEYRYSRFETERVALAPLPVDLDLDTDIHAVRLALSYKFGADDASVFAPVK